jgi:Response regulator of the LytR/AlgR family
MRPNSDHPGNASGILQQEKNFAPAELPNTFFNRVQAELIRFEEKKEKWVWVHPADICFVKSADHYVKTLAICGKEKKWLIRHCTLKELLVKLPAGLFIRLNKFYLVNHEHFSHINEKEKVLYFNDNSFAPVPHRVSPYILDLLATIRECTSRKMLGNQFM